MNVQLFHTVHECTVTPLCHRAHVTPLVSGGGLGHTYRYTLHQDGCSTLPKVVIKTWWVVELALQNQTNDFFPEIFTGERSKINSLASLG